MSTDSTTATAPAFLLLSPLPNWQGSEQKVTEGMAVRRLDPIERQAVEASESLLDHHQIGEAPRDAYWLCYDFENCHPPDNIRYRRRQEAAFKLMLHTMYAVQILAPIGAPNLFLLYGKTDDGLKLESSQRRQVFLETVWGRACPIPSSFGDEVPVLLERVRHAFQKPVLRLQIPVWLLEQGMGAPDRHIRILLWATGLDGITRSGSTAAFAERLCELLGAESRIFPADGAGRQPRYRVADVVEDLYQLRNEMAHGLPFHEKFRKTRGFLADDGRPIAADFANYRYDHVLEECAIFLLSRALKEVLLRNCLFDVQTKRWREQDSDGQ
jgi:hypothetical protein